MKGTFTFTVKTYPKCDEYLRIRWKDEEYKKIEDFISIHPELEETELEKCMVNYRGVEKPIERLSMIIQLMLMS